jgi:hypothetical protein
MASVANSLAVAPARDRLDRLAPGTSPARSARSLAPRDGLMPDAAHRDISTDDSHEFMIAVPTPSSPAAAAA